MKALLWILMTVASAAVAQPADEAKIDINGKLIAPPCTPRFPTSQQVKLGEANLNQLQDDNVAATDVPLIFDCNAGSRVTLTLSAGLGSADSQTLLTNRPALRLRLSLLNKSAKADFSLGKPAPGRWKKDRWN